MMKFARANDEVFQFNQFEPIWTMNRYQLFATMTWAYKHFISKTKQKTLCKQILIAFDLFFFVMNRNHKAADPLSWKRFNKSNWKFCGSDKKVSTHFN